VVRFSHRCNRQKGKIKCEIEQLAKYYDLSGLPDPLLSNCSQCFLHHPSGALVELYLVDDFKAQTFVEAHGTGVVDMNVE